MKTPSPNSCGLLLLTFALLATFQAEAEIRVKQHRVAGQPVVVVLPPGTGPWPAVYALSGLGEMVRGPKAAAWGWVEKYGLKQAMAAVHTGKLTRQNFNDLVKNKQLDQYNNWLKRGYRGVAVICPAVPRKLTTTFERHLINDVIPWAESTLPILKGSRHRGIDGISLGGRHALKIGFKNPKLFRTIGTEQASVRGLARFVKNQMSKNPTAYNHLRVNLLTSKKDGFRVAIERFFSTLEKLSIVARLHVTEGRHDKRFAKGPASIDMLLFHNMHLGVGVK